MGRLLALAACTSVALALWWFLARAQPLLLPKTWPNTPVVFTPVITASLPHDPQAFTQGLVYHEGYFYESTGLYGASSIRKVAPLTGKPISILPLEKHHFGEGLAIHDGVFHQLTWKAGLVFHYRHNGSQWKHHRPPSRLEGEGWGITTDGKLLIVSDGTPTLRFITPDTFQVSKRLKTTCHGAPVDNLNELEWVEGSIFANIWQTDRIIIINPQDGRCRGYFDLPVKDLLTPQLRADPNAVANGIAYDTSTGRLYITGKRWPKIYAIELREIAP